VLRIIHALTVVGKVSPRGGQVFLCALGQFFALGELFHLGDDGINRPCILIPAMVSYRGMGQKQLVTALKA
jgi:uncharacterized SAM-dependent methyltransferase